MSAGYLSRLKVDLARSLFAVQRTRHVEKSSLGSEDVCGVQSQFRKKCNSCGNMS